VLTGRQQKARWGRKLSKKIVVLRFTEPMQQGLMDKDTQVDREPFQIILLN
jgi:hypothetical protein